MSNVLVDIADLLGYGRLRHSYREQDVYRAPSSPDPFSRGAGEGEVLGSANVDRNPVYLLGFHLGNA
jgi:hypothetical protein